MCIRDRKMQVRKDVELMKDEIIRNRRYLHKHPELSFKEVETTKFVAKQLKGYGGIDVQIVKCGPEQRECGIIATIRGKNLRPCIALRADMDGLPILEDNAAEYVSQNKGVMHACGHDGHMSALLGAAKIISSPSFRSRLLGTIKLIFQPAEEGYFGAKEMIKAGCLNGVDEVYGIHLWNEVDVGIVGVNPGALMAAGDLWEIKITGKGGHGAVPESTRDAIAATAHIMVAFQTIVSRNISPLDSAVVTIGEVKGGFAPNVIADSVLLTGTCRSFSKATQALIVRRMKEILSGAEKAFGVQCVLDYGYGYPPTINHKVQTEKVHRACTKIVGDAGIDTSVQTCAAEDFSYYLEAVPGCFWFVGSGKPGPNKVPHHRSDFDIDEDALLISASTLVQLVEDLLTASTTAKL
eukprot:TRINITY_DN2063_c0_g1_i1.p1 TRINITY_DN2063_c0_g1~~TRINITY_DN2063_c0_g1_i1.p1  ORF type:complete len:409 (+),score=70.78 TRINITY_DN2063_c0_g1_i1:49-1275(+)